MRIAPPSAEAMLAGAGAWAYVIIAAVLLLEAVPVLGALIPAQLFLIGAGFLASLHPSRAVRVESLFLLIGVATASLFVADVVSFALGRKFGLSLVDRLPTPIRRRALALCAGINDNVGKTLVFGKFLGPARALAPPLAGSTKVPWWKFLAWEAVGAVVWCTLISLAGYFFGRSYARLERWLGRGSLVLLLVVLVAYLAVQRFRAARQEERAHQAEMASPPPPP